MPNPLSQLSGMIRYELLSHWRRRGLPAAMLLWLLATLYASRLLSGPTMIASSLAGTELAQRISNTIQILIATGSISTILIILTLGVLVAETIPQDSQLGTREWLDALPLGPGPYLGGKLLGVWAAALLGLFTILLLSIPLLRLIIGPYDLPVYLKLWLFALIPAAFLVTSISTLLASVFNSRRWAMFMGIVVAITCYIYLVPGATQLVQDLYVEYMNTQVANMAHLICPADPANCPTVHPAEVGPIPFAGPSLPQTLALGTLVTLLAWLIAYAWQRRQA